LRIRGGKPILKDVSADYMAALAMDSLQARQIGPLKKGKRSKTASDVHEEFHAVQGYALGYDVAPRGA
jgi:hypothetical protein